MELHRLRPAPAPGLQGQRVGLAVGRDPRRRRAGPGAAPPGPAAPAAPSATGPGGGRTGPPGSKPAITGAIRRARATSRVKRLTQSRLRQAGNTPRVETRPQLGFQPTSRWKAAGTRPEPAVSVPRAKSTRPAATAEALPALEPPGTSRGSAAFGGCRRASACRRGRWRTGRGWSCPPGRPRPPRAARPPPPAGPA